MLAMTKKTGYGLIAMSHLASHASGQPVSAREIAGQYGIPVSLLMNVLKDLSAAGLVESVRGARGGYRLCCETHRVSLIDLIEAIEGPFRLAECITSHREDAGELSCPVAVRCPISDPVHRVHDRIHQLLENVSLAELVAPALADRTSDGPPIS
jgi:Rrf2 family protein